MCSKRTLKSDYLWFVWFSYHWPLLLPPPPTSSSIPVVLVNISCLPAIKILHLLSFFFFYALKDVTHFYNLLASPRKRGLGVWKMWNSANAVFIWQDFWQVWPHVCIQMGNRHEGKTWINEWRNEGSLDGLSENDVNHMLWPSQSQDLRDFPSSKH